MAVQILNEKIEKLNKTFDPTNYYVGAPVEILHFWDRKRERKKSFVASGAVVVVPLHSVKVVDEYSARECGIVLFHSFVHGMAFFFVMAKYCPTVNAAVRPTQGVHR